jgi:hypothetical protein
MFFKQGKEESNPIATTQHLSTDGRCKHPLFASPPMTRQSASRDTSWVKAVRGNIAGRQPRDYHAHPPERDISAASHDAARHGTACPCRGRRL